MCHVYPRGFGDDSYPFSIQVFVCCHSVICGCGFLFAHFRKIVAWHQEEATEEVDAKNGDYRSAYFSD